MGTEQNSPSNQTQNGSNENNQTSAGNTTETMFNENNSTMEEVNLNPSEEAQQQGGNVAAPGAGGTEQTGEAASSGSDLDSSADANGDSGEREEDYSDFDFDSEAFEEKNAAEVEDIKSFKLDRKKIYTLSILLGLGYEVGLLGINRKINKNALAKKVQSIKTSKGLISPVLVVTAKKCIEHGLEVYVKGKKVNADASNLEKILVIIDGQHRIQAINTINNKQKKDGNELYDAYVYLPLNEDIDIKTLLRETNVATQPWKGGDYLVSILMSDDENINKDMISWVHTISGKCGDTAAWLWATMDKSRVYSKAKLIEAAIKPEVLKDVANTRCFKEGKALYEKATITLSEDLTKLKVVPTWFIDKKAELIDADYPMSKIMDMLLDFIDNLAPIEVNHIKGLKKDDNSSKDAKIRKALDDLWVEKNKANSKKTSNVSKSSAK